MTEIEKLKKLKWLLDHPDEADISEWEYNFIQDQVISIEEAEADGLLDGWSFTPAVKDKIEELYEKFRQYL